MKEVVLVKDINSGVLFLRTPHPEKQGQYLTCPYSETKHYCSSECIFFETKEISYPREDFFDTVLDWVLGGEPTHWAVVCKGIPFAEIIEE